MNINGKKLYFIDNIIFIGLFILIYIFASYITSNIDSWLNSYQYKYIAHIFYIYIFYIMLKCIIGGFLFIKSVYKKEINISFKLLFPIYNIIFIILFIVLIIIGIKYYFDLVNNYNMNYYLSIFGILFNEKRLYIILIINIVLNLFGIPMYLLYTKEKININKIIKYIISYITIIFILYLNYFLIIMVISGGD